MASPVRRKLTAILSADAQGYSRLMGADEEGTLETLNAHRAIIDGLISQHAGRIVSTAGDGVLAEFASAVDAVRCAIAIQVELAPRNVELPDDRRMFFRIGINVGDVIVEGDDLFGDGVNIAARLESIAEGGGICISGTVYDQVKNKLEVGFADLGEQRVENIAQPVRAYRVDQEKPDTRPLDLPDKPSIAVLPFDNLSGDPEQEYFSDGITEDIITGLSRIRWFFVIARNSTFAYKGSTPDVRRAP